MKYIFLFICCLSINHMSPSVTTEPQITLHTATSQPSKADDDFFRSEIREHFFNHIHSIALFYFWYLPSNDPAIIAFANSIKQLAREESTHHRPSPERKIGIFGLTDETIMIRCWNATKNNRTNLSRHQIRKDFERVLTMMPHDLILIE